MKRMLKAACLLLATMLLFSACGQTPVNNNAQPSASAAAGDKQLPEKLIMGVDDSFPPMGFRDESGEIVGFDIDLAKAVGEHLGVTIEVQSIEWAVKEQELNTKKIDLIWNGYTINEERQKQVLFSKPYLANNQVIVVKKDSGYKTFADLKGKKVGIQTGSSAMDALDEATDLKSSLGQVVEFKENVMALMDLDKGGVDAVAVDEVVANYYIAKDKYDFVLMDEKLAPEEYGIGFRKEDTQLAEAFNSALMEMHKDGSLAKIAEKWFGKDITIIGK